MNFNTDLSQNDLSHNNHNHNNHNNPTVNSQRYDRNYSKPSDGPGSVSAVESSVLGSTQYSRPMSNKQRALGRMNLVGVSSSSSSPSQPYEDSKARGTTSMDHVQHQHSKVYHSSSGFDDEEFPFDEWLNSNSESIAAATGNADIATVRNPAGITTEASNSSSSGNSDRTTPSIKKEPDQYDDFLSRNDSTKSFFSPASYPQRTFSTASSFNSPTVSPPNRRGAISAEDSEIRDVPVSSSSNSASSSSSKSKKARQKLLRNRKPNSRTQLQYDRAFSSSSRAVVGQPYRSEVSSEAHIKVPSRSNSEASTSSVGVQNTTNADSGIKKPKRGRFLHNVVEKKYRTNINTRMAELRNAVPALKSVSDSSRNGSIDLSKFDGLIPATRLNKASILSKATEYIYHLRRKNDALSQEVDALHRFIQQSGLILPPEMQEIHQRSNPMPQFISYSHDGKKLEPISNQPPQNHLAFGGVQQTAPSQTSYGYYQGAPSPIRGRQTAVDPQQQFTNNGQASAPLNRQSLPYQQPLYPQQGIDALQYGQSGQTSHAYVQNVQGVPEYRGQSISPYAQKSQDMHHYIPPQHSSVAERARSSVDNVPSSNFRSQPEPVYLQEQNFYYDENHEMDTVGQPLNERKPIGNVSEARPMRTQMLVGGVAAMLGAPFITNAEEGISSHTQNMKPMSMFSVWLDLPETLSSFKTLCQFILFFFGLFMLLQPVLAVLFDCIGLCFYPFSTESHRAPGFVQNRIKVWERESFGFAFTTVLVKYWAVNCGFLIKDGTNPQHLYQFNSLCHTLFSGKGRIPLVTLLCFYVESLSIVTSGAYRTDESYRFQFNSLVIARVLERRLKSQFLSTVLSIPDRICMLFKELEATKAIRGERSKSMCQMVKLIENDPGFVASNILFDRILSRSFKMEKSWYLVEYVCFIRATDTIRASLIEYIQALSLFGRDILPYSEGHSFSDPRHSKHSEAQSNGGNLSYNTLKGTIISEVIHRISSKIDKGEAVMPVLSPVRLYCSVYQQMLDPKDQKKFQRSLDAVLSSCKRHLENGETFNKIDFLFQADQFRPQDMDVIVKEIESHQHPSVTMHVFSCFSYRLLLTCSWIVHFYYNSDFNSARSLVKYLRTPTDFTTRGDLDVLDLLPFAAAFQVLLVIIDKEGDSLLTDKSEGGLGKENVEVIIKLINYLKIYLNYAVAAPKKFNLLSYDVATLCTQLKMEIHQQLMHLGLVLNPGSVPGKREDHVDK